MPALGLYGKLSMGIGGRLRMIWEGVGEARLSSDIKSDRKYITTLYVLSQKSSPGRNACEMKRRAANGPDLGVSRLSVFSSHPMRLERRVGFLTVIFSPAVRVAERPPTVRQVPSPRNVSSHKCLGSRLGFPHGRTGSHLGGFTCLGSKQKGH
jgi:hypothetical protein